jgi:hypothetical protein
VHFPVHLSPSPHRVLLCAFATTDPPYVIPHPKELTHRLRTNWLRRRAQNRQCSHHLEPAQAEQNVPSTRNKVGWGIETVRFTMDDDVPMCATEVVDGEGSAGVRAATEAT